MAFAGGGFGLVLAALVWTVVLPIAFRGLIDRFAATWVLLMSMLLLASAMLAVPLVTPGIVAVLYGMAVGAAGSSARTLEAAWFPHLFGIRHLGAIRGVVTSISVAASALGPLAVGRAGP